MLRGMFLSVEHRQHRTWDSQVLLQTVCSLLVIDKQKYAKALHWLKYSCVPQSTYVKKQKDN